MKKSFTCHITDQGKVTIPKHIRDKYHLSPDNDMTFECYENGIFIRVVGGVNGNTTSQITLDDYAEREMNKLKGNHQTRPIKRYTDKCTLCGCLHGLILYNEAAFCPTCLERYKDFNKQMEIVKKAAAKAKLQNMSTRKAVEIIR